MALLSKLITIILPLTIIRVAANPSLITAPHDDVEIASVPASPSEQQLVHDLASLTDRSDITVHSENLPSTDSLEDILEAMSPEASQSNGNQEAQAQSGILARREMKKGSPAHIACCIFTLGLCPGGPKCQV